MIRWKINEVFENDDEGGLSKLGTVAAMWCAEKPIYWTELNRKALELIIPGGTIDIFNDDDDKSKKKRLSWHDELNCDVRWAANMNFEGKVFTFQQFRKFNFFYLRALV